PLADSTWGAPMVWWLSPAESFLGSVWVLASEWVLMVALGLALEQLFPSAFGWAIRCRSLLELEVLVPFFLRPAAKFLAQQKESKFLNWTPRYYLIRQARDLPHPAKPSSLHLACFALPNSSESILR